ncbi:MAG TPA: hypothetical protein V6D08_00775 [Candidatus Obscuribacterales bacterium]
MTIDRRLLDALISEVRTEIGSLRTDMRAGFELLESRIDETHARLAETNAALAETNAALAEANAGLAQANALILVLSMSMRELDTRVKGLEFLLRDWNGPDGHSER